MTAMLTQQRAGPHDKSVLLFSGGMDSLCFNHLLVPDVLLYVRSRAVYEAAEMQAMHALQKLLHFDLVYLENVLDLSGYERDDMIVPNRNAHLVLLASNYGDTIYLASVSGDRSTDKDQEFYLLMTQLLDHMWQEQHWTAARRFYILSPFKDWTKTRLVREYLTLNGSVEALLTSYSCYSGAPQPCGICKPCTRKHVALVNNGIDCKGYFAGNFWEADWWPIIKPAIKAGTYRGDEDRDFRTFCMKMAIPL